MTMRNRRILYFITILCIIALLVSMLGCSPKYDPMITRVRTASEVDDNTMEIIHRTNEFDSTAPIVYLVAWLENAEEGTPVTAEWWYAEQDRYIDEITYYSKDTNQTLLFSMNKPTDDWPAGEYEVFLYIYDDKVDTIQFTVIADQSDSDEDMTNTDTAHNPRVDSSSSQDNQATPQPTVQPTETPEPTQQPADDQDIQDGLMEFPEPDLRPNKPLYTVLTDGVWSFIGVANNPNHVGGSDGDFTLGDAAGNMYFLEFFVDETMNILIQEDTTTEEIHYYEIMDTHYADTFLIEGTYGYRFYYGRDGLLYMCFYYDDGNGEYPDITDFFVFDQLGAQVDWEQREIEDDIQDSLVMNIEEALDNTVWISTGVEYDNDQAVSPVTGYPKNYDLEYGSIIYYFEQGIATLYVTDTDETVDSEYLGDPDGYYVYAFHRDIDLNGNTGMIYSIFFINNGKLYEIEMIDGQQVSNIIEYEPYQP